MTVKDVLKRISKVRNSDMREMLLESFSKASTAEKRKSCRIMASYENMYKNDLNFRAKVIAAYVRCYMEDFHSKHLSDAQMKELNPIIRNAIYTFLKDDADDNFFAISGICACNLASYWEDCKYLDSSADDVEEELELTGRV
jgi:hypothetical protein